MKTFLAWGNGLLIGYLIGINREKIDAFGEGVAVGVRKRLEESGGTT